MTAAPPGRICRGILAISAVLLIAAAGAAFGQRAAIASLRVYRQTIAPVAQYAGLRCRLTPTCSRYGEIAIARDGLLLGGWRTVKRIARCGPWTPIGTHDEP